MISYGLNIILGNRAYRIYASHRFSRYLYCTQAPSTATRSPTGSPSRRARLGVLDIPLGGRQTAFPLAVNTVRRGVNVSRKHSLYCHPRTKRSGVKDLHTRKAWLRCTLFSGYSYVSAPFRQAMACKAKTDTAPCKRLRQGSVSRGSSWLTANQYTRKATCCQGIWKIFFFSPKTFRFVEKTTYFFKFP